MADDVYVRLRKFMDTLPAGFPETPTGIEIQILKKMFTSEQAELALELSMEPESVSQISERTGREEAQLAQELEKMAQDGLIFRVRDGEKCLYHAFHFLVGLYEFQLNRLDREFCELYEAYLPYFYMAWAGQTSQMRVIPVASSLGSGTTVARYNQAREMVEAEELISVSQCICRKEQGLLGNECSKPREVCLMLGKTARYYIDNNLGKQITREEAHNILILAEENGLVLSPSNAQKPEMLCCCCSCCCPTLRGIKTMPNPGEILNSGYQSSIDGELCTGCGECIEICPMDAIADDDEISRILAEKCIGCGLCADRCPVEAISLLEREEKAEAPLPTMADVREQIIGERGLQ